MKAGSRARRALVAGAGIAGLAAGIALRRAGFEVEVYERTPELREILAALSIWPNGGRALAALGVEPRQVPVRRLSVRNRRGRDLMDVPVEVMAARYGTEMTFVHRADLQAALLKVFRPGRINLGVEVAGFHQDSDVVGLELVDGGSAEGDLLVGADGLRSVIRRRLLVDGEPVYLGSTVWRGVAGAGGAILEAGQGINWFGAGSEFLAFHLSGGQIYWAGVTKEPEGARPGGRGHRGDLEDRFADWPEPIPTLIAQTTAAAIFRNDMYDRPPAPTWSAGRVTLAGDAAHPMTPDAGQGACQALEDAVALGDCLATTQDLAQGLGRYEAVRLARANWVVRASRRATLAVQFESPVLCALRDAATRFLPRTLLLRTLDATLMPPAAARP